MRQFLLIVCAALSLELSAEVLPAEEQKTFADGLYARGLYELALTEYQTFLSSHPDHPEISVVLVRAGESARKLGQSALAQRYFIQASESGETNESVQRAQLRLLEQRLREGDAKQAVTDAEKLIASGPEPELASAAWYYLAQGRGRLGDARGKQAALERLVRNYAGDPFSIYAALQLGRDARQPMANRKEYFELVLETPPSADAEVEARWGLASLAVQQGDMTEANSQYAQLRKSHPGASRVKNGQVHMAWVSFQAREFETTLELVEKLSASQRGAHGSLIDYLEASALRALQRNDAAKTAFEHLLNNDLESPYRISAAYDLATIYHHDGDAESMVRLKSLLEQVTDQRESALWMLAEAHRQVGATVEAKELFNTISTEFPKGRHSADAAYNDAVLALEANEPDAAGQLEAFSKNYPDDRRAPEILYAAGAAWLEQEQGTSAVRAWSGLLEVYPDDERTVEAQLRLGLLQMRLGLNREAERTLDNYLQRQPSPPDLAKAAFWRGVILAKNGENEDATEMFERVRKLDGDSTLAGKARLRLAALLQEQEKHDDAMDVMLELCASGLGDVLPDDQLVWMMRRASDGGSNEQLILVGESMVAVKRPVLVRELGFYARGRAYRLQGRTADAIEAYEAAPLTSDSADAAEAALALGELLVETGEVQKALDAYERAANVASSVDRPGLQARGWRGLGLAHAQLEQWGESARFLMGVAVLYDDPELSAECLARAAWAFEKSGKTKEAAQALGELRQRYPESTWIDAAIQP